MLVGSLLGSSPWLSLQLTVGAASALANLHSRDRVEYPFQKSPAVTSPQNSSTGTLSVIDWQTGYGQCVVHRKERLPAHRLWATLTTQELYELHLLFLP